MAISRVTTPAEVTELARAILAPERPRPWCVVSIPQGASGPLFDVTKFDAEVGDLSALTLLPTGYLSRQFDALMPALMQVYGGAARVYPTGTSWWGAPHLSPLRFVRSPERASTTTDCLIDDALSMVTSFGPALADAAATVKRSTGIVTGIVAGGMRALVILDDDRIVSVHQEPAIREAPLEWLLHPGQVITGDVDVAAGRMALDLAPTPGSAELFARYPEGTVTLALVLSVTRQNAVLALHPGAKTTVVRADVSANPYDRVDLLLAAGDVVAARVIRDPQGRLGLRLFDVDDDEPLLPAITLLEGGSPWLEENRHRTFPGDLPAVVTPIATALPIDTEPSAELAAARAENENALARIRQLEEQLRALSATGATSTAGATSTDNALELALDSLSVENERLKGMIATSQGQQRDARARLRKSTRHQARDTSFHRRRLRFTDEVAWVRHEIYLAWIDRLDQNDRVEWPLPATYGVGARFADSLANLDESSLPKAFKAVVDILTGRDHRKSHPLHLHSGVGLERVREDGGRCRRAYVEQNTASARRLHYWLLPDGTFELSRVVLHDDMEP